jgi:hypothetical protein
MNVGRFLSLVVRAVSRNGDIPGGPSGASSKTMSPAEKRKAKAARDNLRRSRKALNLMRRFGRF